MNIQNIVVHIVLFVEIQRYVLPRILSQLQHKEDEQNSDNVA